MRFSSTLTSIALAAAALASQAALAEQKLVPAQSAVNFTAKQMGVPLQGHFKKFDAQVQFDTAKRSEEHSLNSSHLVISYAVFCLKKKKNKEATMLLE